MGWESDQEKVEDVKDRSKMIFLGIGRLLAVMVILLVTTHEERQFNSAVQAQHILKMAPLQDPAAREKAYQEMLEIKRQLESGADFGELAAKYSDDDVNKNNDGMMGWIERDETVPEFDAYLWAGEVGAISDIVETGYGFHLIRIVDRRISDAELYEINLNNRVNNMNQ